MRSKILRSVARRVVPKSASRIKDKLRWAIIRLKWSRITAHYAHLPIAEAFSATYRSRLWGSIDGEEFFSGSGSLEEYAVPYADWITQFVREHGIGTVVDIGCGDYRVGRRICSNSSIAYVGIDIVSELVEYNQTRFANERVSFKCLNIITDEPPDGDLCLIRQVLQHLSNEQISRLLMNCEKYRYVVVTEDVYSGPRVRPNLDISHGPANKLFRRSGVFLECEPFAMRTEKILEIPCPHTHSVIRTCLIEGRAAKSAFHAGAWFN